MGITAHHFPELTGHGQAHTRASAVARQHSRGSETQPAASFCDKRCRGTATTARAFKPQKTGRGSVEARPNQEFNGADCVKSLTAPRSPSQESNGMECKKISNHPSESKDTKSSRGWRFASNLKPPGVQGTRGVQWGEMREISNRPRSPRKPRVPKDGNLRQISNRLELKSQETYNGAEYVKSLTAPAVQGSQEFLRTAVCV